jgi:hypothetical protein
MGQNMGQICGLEMGQPCRQLLPPDLGLALEIDFSVFNLHGSHS